MKKILLSTTQNCLCSKDSIALKSLLKKGGLICFPTETVYSLSCDATNKEAIQKIYKVKSRDLNKPLSILMRDIKQMKKYTLVSSQTAKFIKKFPHITYVLPIKRKVKAILNIISDNKVGVRIPANKVALEILKNYPNPLIGTSVNISGQKSATTIKDIPKKILNSVDLVIEDNESTSGMPSTIIDLSLPNQYKILREGSTKKQEIEKYINTIFYL